VKQGNLQWEVENVLSGGYKRFLVGPQWVSIVSFAKHFITMEVENVASTVLTTYDLHQIIHF